MVHGLNKFLQYFSELLPQVLNIVIAHTRHLSVHYHSGDDKTGKQSLQ
jgi:hypothetical protein